MSLFSRMRRPETAAGRRLLRLLRRAHRTLRPAPSGPDLQPLRLHLGCGMDHRPGYVNIDSDPLADCDRRLDFRDLRAVYSENTVAEACLIHSLSYLRLWEARRLFRDLHAILQVGGRLVIELPDAARCMLATLDAGGDLPRYLESIRGLYAFDLDDIDRRRPYVPYAFGWSAWHLKYELEAAGFVEVRLLEPETHGRRLWRDLRCEAIRGA